MFIERTVIGREINPNDTVEGEKDKVLLQLYRFHYNIFNPKDVPMSLKRVSEAVDLSEKRIRDICGMLSEDGLVKIIQISHTQSPRDMFCRITPKGIAFVEKNMPKAELMGA